MNLNSHVRRYMDLVDLADRMFEDVRRVHGSLMGCKQGCDDCCSVYFELSIIEAFVVSWMFHKEVPRSKAKRVLSRCQSSEKQLKEIKDSFQLLPADVSSREDLLEAAARVKVPCPLNEDGGCVLYEHRPITCRLYGVPEKIAGRVVSCPRCEFKPGASYTTVDMEEIQRRLFEYSREFLLDMLGTGPSGPPGPLFFMATTLKTQFDKEFFLSLKATLP